MTEHIFEQNTPNGVSQPNKHFVAVHHGDKTGNETESTINGELYNKMTGEAGLTLVEGSNHEESVNCRVSCRHEVSNKTCQEIKGLCSPASNLDHPEGSKKPEECSVKAKTNSDNGSDDDSLSIVCRICQQSEGESDDVLMETGCECRGSLSHCHKSCLEKWVNVRKTKECELCHQYFGCDVSLQLSARTPEFEGWTDTAETCSDLRRTWFVIIFIFLAVTISSCTAFSSFSHEDLLSFTESNVTQHTAGSQELFEQLQRTADFSEVLMALSFSLLGIHSILWVISELVIVNREVFLHRRTNSLERSVNYLEADAILRMGATGNNQRATI